MKRALSVIAAAATVLAAILFLSATPASANADIQATSVALNAGGEANCNDADLDVGMVATTTTVEAGQTSTLANDNVGFFSHAGVWDGYDGVYVGYGMPMSDQVEGTIVGSHAWITNGTPPTASTAAEWFVLYRCSNTPGGNEVLYSCYGDYGSCPSTAAEAVALLFSGSVDDSSPDPGQTIVASGEGCFYPLGGAVLLDGSTGLGGDSVAPNSDGTYQVNLTVPADVAPGTDLTVRFDCGYDGETVLSARVPITVAEPSTTTTTGATTTTAAPVAAATPRFTG